MQEDVGRLSQNPVSASAAAGIRPAAGALPLVGLLAVLSAFTNFKLASLQPEDVVLLLLLGFCVFKFASSAFSFRISPRLTRLFWSYALLLLTLILLSGYALRLTFYPLDEAPFLKQPTIFSLSKLLQFSAIICGFLWLTNTFIRRRDRLINAINAYWVTGIVAAVYGTFSYAAVFALHFEAPDIFGAYSSLEGVVRARGFFNEGGPFGLYLISVIVIGLLRRHLTGRRLGAASIAILSLAFLRRVRLKPESCLLQFSPSTS